MENLYRDFIYIDDIINGIIKCLNFNKKKFSVFNLGNNNPIKLSYFISIIEKLSNKKFIKEYVKMQPGDVYKTSADITLSKIT